MLTHAINVHSLWFEQVRLAVVVDDVRARKDGAGSFEAGVVVWRTLRGAFGRAGVVLDAARVRRNVLPDGVVHYSRPAKRNRAAVVNHI